MEYTRLIAVFIDFLIAACINTIPFTLLVMLPMVQTNGQMESPELMGRALIASLIAMLYLVFRDIPSGGSIGKKSDETESRRRRNAGPRFYREENPPERNVAVKLD